MMIQLIYWIISIIASIVLLLRFGIFSKLMGEFLAQKILDKISSLNSSSPNLTSTFDSNNSTSR